MLGEFTLANNVRATLNASITNTATSITVNAASAPYNNPPNPSGDNASGGVSILTITDVYANPTVYEIITYTGVTGTGPYTLTGVTRGVQGTTAAAWSAGAVVFQAATAAQLSHQNVTYNKTTSTLGAVNLSLSGTLAVALAATFSSTVGITGNTTVGGTLGVTGAATLGATTAPTFATTTNALGTVGATATANFTTAATNTLTLTSATASTLSFSAPPAANTYVSLRITQPASGTVTTVTWPASAIGSPPQPTATLGAMTTYLFWYDGTNYTYLPNTSLFTSFATAVLRSPIAAPSSPANGWEYFDSTTKRLTTYDGSAWQTYVSRADLNGGTLPASLTTLTASGQVLGTIAAGGPGSTFLAKSSAPYYGWQNTSAAADAGVWDIGAGTSTLTFRTVNDANSAASTWLTVSRVGYAPVLASFGVGAQFTGGITSSSGAGAEALWNGGAAIFQGYNRGTSAYAPVIFAGSTLTFSPNGTSQAQIDSTGWNFGSYYNQPPRRSYSVSATAGTWYRVGSLPATNQGQSATIYLSALSNAGGNPHFYAKLEIGKTTSGALGTTFEYSRLGQYSSTNYISSIRVVDDGTNAASHVDVQFSTTGTYTDVYVSVFNQNANVGTNYFFDDGLFASQGTTAAGTAFDAGLMSARGDTTYGIAYVIDKYGGFTSYNDGFNTQGTNGQFKFYDRTNTAQNWTWYANSGTARLWNDNLGDIATFDRTSGRATFNRDLQANSVGCKSYPNGGALGATPTIDLGANGGLSFWTISQNTAVTFSNAVAGQLYTVVFQNTSTTTAFNVTCNQMFDNNTQLCSVGANSSGKTTVAVLMQYTGSKFIYWGQDATTGATSYNYP